MNISFLSIISSNSACQPFHDKNKQILNTHIMSLSIRCMILSNRTKHTNTFKITPHITEVLRQSCQRIRNHLQTPRITTIRFNQMNFRKNNSWRKEIKYNKSPQIISVVYTCSLSNVASVFKSQNANRSFKKKTRKNKKTSNIVSPFIHTST